MRAARSLAGLAALAVLAALVLAPGCGGPAPIPPVDLRLRVEADATEVAPGAPFHVTVERIRRKDLEVEAWDESALAPLRLELESTERREDEGRVLETWRYRAYAFTRADLHIPGVRWSARPRDGGPLREVAAGPLRLAVTPQVESDAPGPPELPGPPLPEPASSLPLLLALALAGAAAALGLALRRPRPGSARRAGPVRASPGDRARERLDALRGHATPPDAAIVEAGAVLRGLVAEVLAVPTGARTTPEILAIPTLPPPTRDLGAVLEASDLVKFAAWRPSRSDADRVLEAAERVLGGEAAS